MRQTLRAAGLLVFAVVAITCTDAPTGPSGAGGRGQTAGRLGLAPSFSADAARAYRGMVALGFDVTSVRIRLTAADGKVAKDTVIAFPAVQDTLVVDLPVLMQGTEQAFTALLELRDANGVVLFSGSRLVTARAGSLPGAVPPSIALEYSGPGRDARSISVLPATASIGAGASLALSAAGADAAGNAVPDLLVQWSSSDSSLATVASTAAASADLRGAGRRGSVTITATTPTGLTSVSQVALVPPPARLVVTGGSGQTAVAGRALPVQFSVEVQAADGGPVPNTAVAFRAVTAGGSVGTASATTDPTGRASSTITLGKTAGDYVFEAAVGALAPVTVSATATPAPAAAIALVSGDAQTDSIAQPLPQPLVVRVTDEFGGPVAGAQVGWAISAGTGSLGAASTTTGADGLTSTSYKLGTAPGTERVSATLQGVAGASVDFSFQTIARRPHAIAFRNGTGQSGAVGSQLPAPLVVLVTDILGNAVAGALVDWTLTGPAGGSISPASGATDAAGLAQSTVKLPTTAGTVTATARVGSLSASTPLVATSGKPGKFILLQSLPGSIAVGVPSSTSLRVQLADTLFNPVAQAGVVVTLTGVVTPGNPPPLSATATSDAAGIVTFNLPAYAGALGTASITISASGFSSLVAPTVTFVTGPTARVKLLTQPSASATSGAALTVQPILKLTDVGSNPVSTAGVSVTASIASGTGTLAGTTTVTTDATGQATFTDLSITGTGAHTLTFSSGSLTAAVSNPIAVAAAATPVALDSVPGAQAPAASSTGTVLSTFKVRLVDGAQQGVARSNVPITLRATPIRQASPNVPLTGTTTRLTDAAGIATFDDVAFNAASGYYTLTARADSAVLPLPVLTLVDSLTLFTGTAATIAVSTGARTLAASGTTVAGGTVTFQVKDALGSTTPSRSYTVTLSTTGNCSIQPGFRTVNTGFTSTASVPIDMGSGAGGCIVSAATAGVGVPAEAQLVAAPGNATHVWFGAVGGGTSAWEGSAGWLPVPPMTAGSWPSSQTADDAYVANWSGRFTSPRLTVAQPAGSGPLAIRRLYVEPLGVVDLGGMALIVAGDSAGGLRSVSATNASVVNGQIRLYGNGALVTGGLFDRLLVGDTLTATSNFCASNSISAMLRNVAVTNALDVRCKLAVDSSVTAGAVNSYADAAQPGWIHLPNATSSLTTAAGSFAGDSLVVAGGLVKVTGGATFNGRLSMSSGTALQVGSDANFQGGGTLANAQVVVGRNATFGGTSSTGYSLIGGKLEVAGNFTQIVSGIGTIFVASSDHVTRFTGTTLQQVSFANPTQSGFSLLELANGALGVELNGTVNVGAGTTTPRTALLAGARLFVRTGVTLGVQGSVVLGTGSALDVASGANVQVTGTCTGRTTNGASVTGAGTVNGAPISAATCAP